MSVPRVSICIPTYNGARFLAATLDSVFAQTEQDFELILVDDGSTDDTLSVAERYADPRLRIIRNERNQGVGPTWNRAVREGTAEAVRLLCQDDVLCPDAIRSQLKVLVDDTERNVALVSGLRTIITAAGRVLIQNRGLLPRDITIQSRDAVRRIVRSGTNPIGEPSAVLFRRSAFDRTNGFDGSNLFAIDIAMWTDLLHQGNLHHLGQTVCLFRVSANSLSTRLAKTQRSMVAQFVNRTDESWPGVVSGADKLRGALMRHVNVAARRFIYGWARATGRI